MHYPSSGGFNWPCAAKYHSSRHADRKHCYAEWSALPTPKPTFEKHHDVLATCAQVVKKQMSPPSGRKTFTVAQDPNPEARRVRARTEAAPATLQ